MTSLLYFPFYDCLLICTMFPCIRSDSRQYSQKQYHSNIGTWIMSHDVSSSLAGVLSWNMNIEIQKSLSGKQDARQSFFSPSENLKTKFFIEVRHLKCHIFIWWNKDSSLVITTYTPKLVVTVSFLLPTGIWVVLSINHLLVSAVSSLHSWGKCWGKFWG